MRRHGKSTRLAVHALEARETPAAGQLDYSFGSGGMTVTADITDWQEWAGAMTVDPAGRIYVAGFSWGTGDGWGDFLVTRYQPTGELDLSFNRAGFAVVDFGTNSEDYCGAVAIAPDGKIVLAGGSQNHFAVARLNSDGTPDTTFSGDGRASAVVGGGNFDSAYGVAVQPDGKIVAAGTWKISATASQIAVVRWNANGTLDTGFDGDGIAVPDVGSAAGLDVGYGMTLQPDGKVLVVGSSRPVGGMPQFTVARLTTGGALDTSFNTTGWTVTNVSPTSYSEAQRVVLQPDGKIVVGGYADLPHAPLVHSDFVAVRYTTAGALDTTFDTDGIAHVDMQGSRDEAHGVAIDSLGRIVLSGYAFRIVGGTPTEHDVGLARLLPNGAPDTGFGPGGVRIYEMGSTHEDPVGVSIDAAGGIVVAVDLLVEDTNLNEILLARFDGNDAPTVSPGVGTATTAEDNAAVAVAPSLVIADVDSVNLAAATVTVGNYLANQDVIGFTQQGGVVGNFDAVAGVLSLSGTAPLADYQAVLRSVTYRNTSNNPDTHLRTFEFAVNDGYVTEYAGAGSRAVAVTAVNDAPDFTDGSSLPNVRPGAFNPPGVRVSTLFAGLFIDPDLGDTLGGVAVVANPAPTSEGDWQYSTDGTTWFNVGTVSDGPTALALSAVTQLRFRPATGFNGDATPLSVRAVDSSFAGPYTVGGTRQLIDTTTPGGSTPVAATTNLVTVTVDPAAGAGNGAPTLTGVPVSFNVNEGSPFTFDADATDPDGDTVQFALLGAPAGATIDPDTGSFAWTPTEAQGPQTYVFIVRATDGLANTDRTVTAIVGEVNLAPVLSGLPAPITAVRGQKIQFDGPTVVDDDQFNGEPNALTFSLVGAPVGAIIDPDTGDFAWNVGGSVPDGQYTFDVRVVDDGVPAKSDRKPVTITIATTALVNGDLFIGGTDANDVIAVNPSKNGGTFTVLVNKEPFGPFTTGLVTGRVVIHALGGNDKVTLNAKLTKGADLYGEAGNDALTGGAGPDLLVGGDGVDVLTGGAGKDVLVGGRGADKLSGGTGEDLLIGGATTFDLDPIGLAAVRLEWSASTTYEQRIDHLQNGGGLNGATKLSAATIPDDLAKDVLTGGGDRDWFLVRALDTAGKAKDETLTTL
jgi:uncharacterized delta-60 repeat protein